MKIDPPIEASRSELSVVPLVNVVFLLLVFFMLVGQITSPEPLRVDPPRSESGHEDTGQTVKILVTRDGRIAIDSEVIPALKLDDRVARIIAANPSASFQIKADGSADGVALIRTMERLRASGVKRLTLLTERIR
jgi:biopolymer transport protein ExbD